MADCPPASDLVLCFVGSFFGSGFRERVIEKPASGAPWAAAAESRRQGVNTPGNPASFPLTE